MTCVLLNQLCIKTDTAQTSQKGELEQAVNHLVSQCNMIFITRPFLARCQLPPIYGYCRYQELSFQRVMCKDGHSGALIVPIIANSPVKRKLRVR